MIRRFLFDTSGATLVEYGIAMLLAIALGGAALTGLVGQISSNFNAMCDSMVVAGQTENRCDE